MHATSHVPQSVSVRIEVSQPFGWRLSQLSQPLSQLAMRHAPLSQLAVA
jgi:hypothetical protein